jgi:hypothetical protein
VIAVADHDPRRPLEVQRLDHLLGRPLARRRLGDPEPSTRRRSCASTKNTYRLRVVAIGTSKKSTDAISRAWLTRNVLHPWEGCRWTFMCLATVGSLIATPSLSSSPWMRGAPHSEHSSHPCVGETGSVAEAGGMRFLVPTGVYYVRMVAARVDQRRAVTLFR